jgi:hypothetical protein
MTFRKLVVLIATSFLVLSGCPKQELFEGGVYSVESVRGGFSIVKIFKLDSGGVHICLYSNHFAQRPPNNDVSFLYLIEVPRKPKEEPCMGHMPLSSESFAGWRPKLIKIVSVQSTELEGYEKWRQAKGGYF